MTSLNRPYTFELAAMALADPGQHDDVRALAECNGVGPDHFERAVLIVNAIASSGEGSRTSFGVSTSSMGGCPVIYPWTPLLAIPR